jgi:5'-deoxynucleotidase YfbR-like HD superfamily hydrolase
MKDRDTAIRNLYPNVVSIYDSGSYARDGDGNSVTVDEAKVQAEMDKLKSVWDAQEYARKREAEYPSIKELVVAIYDSEDMAAIEARRAAVKAKYPKRISGNTTL